MAYEKATGITNPEVQKQLIVSLKQLKTAA